MWTQCNSQARFSPGQYCDRKSYFLCKQRIAMYYIGSDFTGYLDLVNMEARGQHDPGNQ